MVLLNLVFAVVVFQVNVDQFLLHLLFTLTKFSQSLLELILSFQQLLLFVNFFLQLQCFCLILLFEAIDLRIHVIDLWHKQPLNFANSLWNVWNLCIWLPPIAEYRWYRLRETSYVNSSIIIFENNLATIVQYLVVGETLRVYQIGRWIFGSRVIRSQDWRTALLLCWLWLHIFKVNL